MTDAAEQPEERASWQNTFQFGDFVRLTRNPQLWGRIVGPSEFPGRWIFEYPQGARVTAEASAFEKFQPTAVQIKNTTARFEQLAAQYDANRRNWPEQYRV